MAGMSESVIRAYLHLVGDRDSMLDENHSPRSHRAFFAMVMLAVGSLAVVIQEVSSAYRPTRFSFDEFVISFT